MFRGLVRGLQLIADYLTLIARMAAAGNTAALRDLAGVARLWLSETVDETGRVKLNPWRLLGNADPWRGSRAAFAAIKARWTL